jgi:hypothetical protein
MTALTPEQIEQDELILAAIIAGGMASGRRVEPCLAGYRRGQDGHSNGFGVMSDDRATGPCCAVGAGVLFAGQKTTTSPFDAFARKLKIGRDYAVAVSAGFEGQPGYEGSLDEARGHAVGSAAWDFFCGDAAP